MQLSQNFSLKELTRSDTALRLNIDNTPNETEIKRLKDLCINILQPVRNNFGRITVNSGFRKPELCEKIGSNPRSNHAFGFAADIEPIEPGITNFEVLEWIALFLPFKELIAEYFDKDDENAGWVHVAFQEGNNKGVIKLKDKNHNYDVVTLDELRQLYT